MTAAADVREVPTLPGQRLLGSMREIRRDYLGTVSRAAREVGGIARIVAGPPGWRVCLYVVTSPELAAEILGQPERFRKNAPGYNELRGAVGDNVLTSQDDVWRRQRRFLAPIFTPRRIVHDYAPIMADEAQQLVARWDRRRRDAETVDAFPEMVKVTSKVIGRILFGADVSRAVPQLQRYSLINDELLRRAVSPHPMPRWLPTPANRRLDAELAHLRQVVDEIIAERRAEPSAAAAPDLLGLLLRARDADHPGDRLSEREVADQVLIFLLAGLETTAVTLACTLVELARATEWQDLIRAEIQREVGDQPITSEDVPALVWTDRVLHEAMRLFPAAHGMARTALREEVLGGCRVPQGSWLEVSPWGVHHSPAVWTNPATFDPRRFEVARGTFPGGHRYAWFPFGIGARACLGAQIAMLEMRVVLGTVVRSFSLGTSLATTPVRAAITLQPSGGLPIRLGAPSSRGAHRR